tara:strand:- start:1564 stop:1902 length:339 start_codon:yes stop_codon:yes gene_type:complete
MRILGLVMAFLALAVTFSLTGCDNFETKHKKTVEERLVDAFATMPDEMRQRIDQVVADSDAKAYQQALNELALISHTTRLTAAQKRAVDDLMRQLRYDMEEEELARQQSNGS